MKDKRNNADKLRTLLFGKDLRITKGDVYSEVREYDFSSYYPEEKYISEPLRLLRYLISENTVQMSQKQTMPRT